LGEFVWENMKVAERESCLINDSQPFAFTGIVTITMNKCQWVRGIEGNLATQMRKAPAVWAV